MAEERVRNSATSPPPASNFAAYGGTPLVLCEDGTAWMMLPNGTVVMIGDGMKMEQEVGTTGLYRGKAAELVTVLGSRSLGWTSTSIFGDAADYLDTSQATINTPVVGATYYLVSTSAQDAAGGTGADRAVITYLDATGLQQTVTKTLTGTTPVSLGSGFTYFQFLETDHSSATGRMAAGSITISSINGVATVATTMDKVSAGGNRSLSGRWKCPSDSVAYALDWWASAISATMDVRLRETQFVSGEVSNSFHFQDRAFLTSGASTSPERHYHKINTSVEIKLSAIPGGVAAGNKLDCNIELVLVKL